MQYDLENDSNDLDISWIQSHERFINIHKNYQREPTEAVSIYYLYINLNLEIEKIICEKETLDLSCQNISKERVLQMVQNKKKLGSTKYNLDNILIYNVTIESENIQKYVNSENIADVSQPFIKILPVIDEIKINPSIFIFHSLNSVFFFFKQCDNRDTFPITKSILKRGNGTSAGPGPGPGTGNIDAKKKTKKVRILGYNDDDENNDSSFSNKKHNITKRKHNV
jgi:hypothetical protein